VFLVMEELFTIDEGQEFNVVCKTELKGLKYRFLWVIEKFSELSQPNGQSIETCDLVYKDSGLSERKWKLKLYPNGRSSSYGEKVSIDLINESGYTVTATYEISAFDGKKNRLNTVSDIFVFENNWYAVNEALQNFAVKRLFGEKLLPDDTLSIVCDITESPTRRTVSVRGGNTDKSNPKTLFNSVLHKELVKDMNNIFMDKDNGYNIIIRCEDQVFYCHKFMLSARSPVFHAMFQSDMVENKSGSVDVEDIHPNVMIEMLRYIYSGCMLAIEIYGRELLAAAEKYQLDKLKICCEEYLSGTLDVENCIDLLILSDFNQATTLKKAAFEFFTKNLSSFNSGDWEKRLKDHPILAIEVMKCLFSMKNAFF